MYSPYFPKFTEPEDILRFIDDDAKQVLYHIPNNRLRHVAHDLKLPTEIIRMIAKELRVLGLIEQQYYVMYDELYLCGSGYILTDLGYSVVTLLNQGKTYDDFCHNDS